MSTALTPAVQGPQAIQEWKSPAQIKQRIDAIQGLMRTVLKEGVDYGKIPGMPKDSKPTLFKPGSEQILSMFCIAAKPIVEDLSTPDCFRYRVTVELTNEASGTFLGAGVGECSSHETKYKWRRTYVKEEYDATDPDRRRIKFSRFQKNGKWETVQEMQIRQEPADVANTCLKIAKKRGQIDATLTTTGASSMFGQDWDTMNEETREELWRQEEEQQPRQTRKAPLPKVEKVVCGSCGKTDGHEPTCRYSKEANQPTQAPPQPQSPPPPTQTMPQQPTPQQEPANDGVAPFLVTKLTPGTTKAGVSFMTVEAVDSLSYNRVLYCFSKTLCELLQTKGLQKVCLLKTEEKNGKFKLADVIEIVGVKYQDGKPVSSAPVDEDW